MQHKNGQEIWDSHQRVARLRAARLDPSSSIGFLEECRVIREFIDPKNLAHERVSDGRAWFKYGQLPLLQRNQLYTEAYVEASRDLQRTLGGAPGKAPYNPVYPDFVRNSQGVMNVLSAGRQCADGLGMPYDSYCRAVIRALMLKQGHHNMPRPNQLAGAEAIELATAVREATLDSHARTEHFNDGAEPRWMADSYRGDPVQVGALDALERRVRKEMHGPKLLGKYLTDGFVSEQEARDRFGDVMVDRAIRDHGPARFAVNGAGDLSAYRPGCFGYAFEAGAKQCGGCPVQVHCERATKTVDCMQIAATGWLNPRLERERAGWRKRKRRERHRKTPEGAAAIEAGKLELCEHIPGLTAVFYPEATPTP